ncbi:MAG: ABC transporter ATP-binding protein, partial [Anaerolineae bacterium]|nr:ABC transporter ATP-binding protein [Anaerolineae bacterium]
VEAVCDRVGIIRQGELVRVGTLEELAGGTLQVEIRARALTPELIAGLARWGRVVRQEGGEQVLLETAEEEALPAIAAWLVENGVRLYALTPCRRPLEDLFVQIVEGAQ